MGALVKKKQLSSNEEGWFSRLVEGLLPILIQLFQGNEDAKTQLKAIDKLLYPKIYELPKTVIKDLVERYHTRPALARGWRIRKLIGGLSWVVKPARADAVSVLDGAVVLDEAEGKSHTIYSVIFKKHVPAYELAKRHWMRGVTLQNLAIRIYLEELQTLEQIQG